MYKLVGGISMSVESTRKNVEMWRENTWFWKGNFQHIRKEKKMLSRGEGTDGFGKMDKATRGGERSNILEWKVRGLTSFFLWK